MRVHPAQLVEGCILLQDVIGKSGRPIMKEKTVLADEHITILHKFFIDSVEVSSKLASGKAFHPKPSYQKNRAAIKEPTLEVHLEAEERRSFPVHYQEVVSVYKQVFLDWRNGIPIDIAKVRKTLIPLLERVEELDMEIFTLHQYGQAEDYLYHHSVAVGLLSAFLGKELRYRKGEWLQVGLAGFLSDAGMAKVDQRIESKAGPLTELQMEEIRNHPTYSYQMVDQLTGLSKGAKLGILNHHERTDGSGYPHGRLKGEIPPYARIIAIADMYHAMTSDRIYKERKPIYKAINDILQERYTKLDAEMVHTFVKSLTKRAVGKTVHLTNNQTGEIVFVDEGSPTRPLIKLHENEGIISLQMNPELQIDEIILD